jgi:hypothetical protein
MKKSLALTMLLPVIILFYSCNESAVEPDTQFVQIFLKYGFNNELNTFNNTFQKDLVLDGTITVPFWLTTDEQNRILSKANEVNFFSLPDTLEGDTTLMVIDPNPGYQTIRIKNENNDKTVNWIYPLNYSDSSVVKALELYDFMISIIEAKPEFKKLPPSRGSYL